jgi:hypothetical protein
VPVENWEPLKKSIEREEPKATALIELHRAFPEYSDLMSSDSYTKLAALPTAEREQIRGRVRDFLPQRPDLAVAFADPTAKVDEGCPDSGSQTDRL